MTSAVMIIRKLLVIVVDTSPYTFYHCEVILILLFIVSLLQSFSICPLQNHVGLGINDLFQNNVFSFLAVD